MLEIENGNIIGDWTVICKGEDYISPKTRSKHPRYVCKCECGKKKLVRQSSLENGDSRGCGCNRDRQTAERMKTHGNSQHVLYQTWYDMNRRCCDPSRKDYKHYGGRGITVWSGWQGETGFEQFVLDMYPTYSDKLEIDRLGKLKWDAVKAFTTPVKYKRLRVSYKNVKIPSDEVFNPVSTCYARAKREGLNMGKYTAAVFYGTMLDVEGQYQGDWEVIKPEYVPGVTDRKHHFSDDFVEFCHKEGLNYEL